MNLITKKFILKALVNGCQRKNSCLNNFGFFFPAPYRVENNENLYWIRHFLCVMIFCCGGMQSSLDDLSALVDQTGLQTGNLNIFFDNEHNIIRCSLTKAIRVPTKVDLKVNSLRKHKLKPIPLS